MLLAATTLALVALVGLVWASSPAWAAEITVDTTADEQNTNTQCSLREAILNANGDNQSGSSACAAGNGEDTIHFGLGPSATITLGSQLPTITDTDKLTIDGQGAEITVSGNDSVRVFVVDSGAALDVTNLTVADGLGFFQGGGLINGGGHGKCAQIHLLRQ
jgi:CSLREA domain-containing protein